LTAESNALKSVTELLLTAPVQCCSCSRYVPNGVSQDGGRDQSSDL